MSKKSKLLKKFLAVPIKKDLTFDALETLLLSCGYRKLEGSGSAVKFYHEEKNHLINLHKLHPDNVLKLYLIKQIRRRYVMANVLDYKGYIAMLSYSSEDKVFYGKLEMIEDLVTFEAESARDLEVNFHNAVDEYLDTCKSLRREPQKTYKGIFNVRIDPTLHKKAYQQSIKNGISLNAFVKQAIEKEVALG